MNNILFVCTHNSGRSQIAEAIFNQIAKTQKLDIQARSAGTSPSESLNKNVSKVLTEIDIDTSRLKPKELTAKLLEESDGVITMGCKITLDQCLSSQITNTIDWPLPDPTGMCLDQTRKIRETIHGMVLELIEQNMNT